MFGLIMDLAGLLNLLNLNTLIFQLIDHYQEVLIWIYLLNYQVQVNMKNKDEKCFLWCHVRYINLLNKHRERILKNDKKIAEELNYGRIEFPVQEKDFNKTEIKNNICINVFGYENELIFPIYISEL